MQISEATSQHQNYSRSYLANVRFDHVEGRRSAILRGVAGPGAFEVKLHPRHARAGSRRTEASDPEYVDQ